MGMMDINTEDIPWVTWITRAFIVIVIVIAIWWFTKRHKKYKYIGVRDKHNSMFGNIFKFFTLRPLSTLNNVKQKRENKTENICRGIIERIYNKPFPSIRPDFLKSPMTKRNLELDCYNDELKIALEYNGQQHYQYTPRLHRKGKHQFYSQVHRDDWKRKKCKELGITLVEIPYWITVPNLEDFIRKELVKKKVL